MSPGAKCRGDLGRWDQSERERDQNLRLSLRVTQGEDRRTPGIRVLPWGAEQRLPSDNSHPSLVAMLQHNGNELRRDAKNPEKTIGFPESPAATKLKVKEILPHAALKSSSS